MANKIQVKRSAVPSKVPTTADLDLGEIAINTYDGIAYIKKDNGTASIVPLGGGGGSGDVVGPSSATDNALARFDGTTGKLIQNGIVTQDDNGTLGNVNAISLDTTPTSAPTSQGALVWDVDYNTLSIQNNTNVHTHAGQQNYFYVKASSAISKGDLCYFTGVVGASGVIQAAPAIAGITNAQYILGIAAESIALNGFGYVQTFGILKGFDTSAWTAGNILYYDSTNGGLTATYPTSGIIVTVAAVINASAGAGIVAIRPQVTQRITAGTGVSVSQTTSGTSVSNTGVTSVTGTSPINSSGGATPAISLASGYGDTQNPYASKTANYVLAAPNGSAGAPTFRAIVAADIPTLNQNTTGNAGTVGGISIYQLSNNMGNNHSTYQTFAAIPNFGTWFMQNSAAGDAPQASQFYARTQGLGNDYAYSQYAMMEAVPRNVSAPYRYIRFLEGGTWGSWQKQAAGYADSANYSAYLSGAAAFTNGSDGWWRSNGSAGWYNNSYSGGIYMQDTTWVRTYNGKYFYCDSYIACAGNITAYYSDERLKTIKGNIPNALEKVCSLDGFIYEENELAFSLMGDKRRGKLQAGLSAQQVQKVLPEVVSLAPFDIETDEKEMGKFWSKSGENYLTVDYAHIVPLLVEAIKELRAEIKMLKGK